MTLRIFGDGSNDPLTGDYGDLNEYTGDTLPTTADDLLLDSTSPELVTGFADLAAVVLASWRAERTPNPIANSANPVEIDVGAGRVTLDPLNNCYVKCAAAEVVVDGVPAGKTIEITSVGTASGTDIDALEIRGGAGIVRIKAGTKIAGVPTVTGDFRGVLEIEAGVTISGVPQLKGGTIKSASAMGSECHVRRGATFVPNGSQTQTALHLDGGTLAPSGFSGSMAIVAHEGKISAAANGTHFTISSITLDPTKVVEDLAEADVTYGSTPVPVGRDDLGFGG